MKKFVKNYLNGMSRPDAVRLAGYKVKSTESAHSVATQVLHNPLVEEEIEKVLERRGLSKDYIAYNLKRIIDAGVDNAEQTATADSSLRGLDMLLRTYDAYPSERKINDNRSVTYNFNSMSLNDLKAKLDELENEGKRYLETTQNSTPEAVETTEIESKPIE